MNYEDFINKFGFSDDLVDELRLLDVLDELYLNFTLEQVIEIVTEYFKYADDIQNSILEDFNKGLQKILNDVIKKEA